MDTNTNLFEEIKKLFPKVSKTDVEIALHLTTYLKDHPYNTKMLTKIDGVYNMLTLLSDYLNTFLGSSNVDYFFVLNFYGVCISMTDKVHMNFTGHNACNECACFTCGFSKHGVCKCVTLQ